MAQEKKSAYISLGIVFGLMAGTLLGVVFSVNIGLAAGMGMCAGIFIASLFEIRDQKLLAPEKKRKE